MTDVLANDDATQANGELTKRLSLPLEDALKRAYYYTEAGEWRGPEVAEWERWHAVAKVAAAQVEAERERCAKIADEHARRNYPWGSENTDRYHAQADWAARIAAVIRRDERKIGQPKERKK